MQREEVLVGPAACARVSCAPSWRAASSVHVTPELHFVYDASVERGMRLSRLIDDAVGGKPTD